MKRHIKKAASLQSVRFALVGIANTILDFVILNLLVTVVGLPRVPANTISATVAMVGSFIANRKLVFKHQAGGSAADYRRQIILFIVVTVAGLYILQNGIIYLLTEVWTWPLDTAADIFTIFDRDFIYTNGSKAIATAFSLVWNFVLYKRLVFKGSDEA